MVQFVGTAAGYLRKSRSDDPTREVSREVQELAVRRLAAKDGFPDVTLYIDWDRSGDDAKIERRTAYTAMLQALSNGEISAIYAYSPDRLYRGMSTFVQLTRAASERDVRLVTANGEIEGDGTPLAVAYAQIGAVFAQLELNTAKARARAAADVRRRRGDHLGAVPYGYQLERCPEGVRLVRRPDQPTDIVLDAWERSGRRPRTCARILNDELGLKSARGGTWDRPSLLRLIAREAPDRLPRRAPSGRRSEAPSPARFAKLLRCHCGRTLTPNVHRERREGRASTETVSYYCARGHASRADHPRVYVAESVLMPWMKGEAGRLIIPFDEVVETASEGVQGQLDALDAKQERVIEAHIEGLIAKADRDRRLKEISSARERLDTRRRAVSAPVGRIDWSWPPTALNDVLRNLWSHVEVDEQLRPIRAEWAVSEWRA